MKNELADSIAGIIVHGGSTAQRAVASSITIGAVLAQGLEIALKLTVLWHAARILGGM